MTYMRLSARNAGSMTGYTSGTIGTGSGVNRYVPLYGYMEAASDEYACQYQMPFNALIRNLRFIVNAAPGGVQTRTVTLRVDGVSKALTCTISAAETSAMDLTHVVKVNAGSLVNWLIADSGGVNAMSYISCEIVRMVP